MPKSAFSPPPQGRLVAPINEKFGTAEWQVSPLRHEKFHLNRCTQKLKIFTFWLRLARLAKLRSIFEPKISASDSSSRLDYVRVISTPIIIIIIKSRPAETNTLTDFYKAFMHLTTLHKPDSLQRCGVIGEKRCVTHLRGIILCTL